MSKTVFLFLYLAQTIALQAKDMGSHGVVYPIDEQDPIILIQNKLKNMEKSGELDRHHLEIQKKTRDAIERPKPVAGLTKFMPEPNQGAIENHIFYYDPTYIVPEDLKDHRGKIFYKKGTKINPLETVSLSQNLIFFDGDDPAQVTFAKEKRKEGSIKLILVKGAPLTLSEESSVPVYFDQSGLLTQKLGIKHVPALVTQEDKHLRIEEFNLREDKFSLIRTKKTGEIK
ncbi:MAG: type-F conjugative transfer system protein TraW [Alphaproteobacteria bacterium]|nr:type-F conjugative transfer system protein TraW [Alphaproteobacteria bacterium]